MLNEPSSEGSISGEKDMWTEEECKECQWCCRHQNLPIPGTDQYAYLDYVKGFPVYWEPLDSKWYVLNYRSWQHISYSGCMIQSYKPVICKDWYCPFGPKRIRRFFGFVGTVGE